MSKRLKQLAPNSFEVLKLPEVEKNLNRCIITTVVNGVGKDFLLRKILPPQQSLVLRIFFLNILIYLGTD